MQITINNKSTELSKLPKLHITDRTITAHIYNANREPSAEELQGLAYPK